MAESDPMSTPDRTHGFDHLVLTRFSAVFAGQVQPMPEEWLRYRLQFFYDTAYPSLTQQVGAAPFRWLVFLDDRCGDDFRAEVEDLSDRGRAFEPVWTHDVFRLSACVRAVTARAHARHLITTRVDSDDAVATDFVAAVQQQFDGQERMFVSFARGLQVDRSGAVYRRDQPSGPFLSLIERRVDESVPLTVYATKHARARELAPVREVATRPMWVQVVHGGNVANVVYGPRVSPALVDERFVLTLPFRRDVPAARLVRERAAHRARLTREWLRHPGRLTATLEARLSRRRGTHDVPLGSTPTLTDRARRLARRVGYRTDAP